MNFNFYSSSNKSLPTIVELNLSLSNSKELCFGDDLCVNLKCTKTDFKEFLTLVPFIYGNELDSITIKFFKRNLNKFFPYINNQKIWNNLFIYNFKSYFRVLQKSIIATNYQFTTDTNHIHLLQEKLELIYFFKKKLKCKILNLKKNGIIKFKKNIHTNLKIGYKGKLRRDRRSSLAKKKMFILYEREREKLELKRALNLVIPSLNTKKGLNYNLKEIVCEKNMRLVNSL